MFMRRTLLPILSNYSMKYRGEIVAGEIEKEGKWGEVYTPASIWYLH